jgi:hypothetical protein
MGGMSYRSPAREPTAKVTSWTIQICITSRSRELSKHGWAYLGLENAIQL